MHLTVSAKGYKDGDFTMIMGFPGTTTRYMTTYEIDEMLDVANPNANAAIDHQLISAVGYQQGVATSRFEQLADELVGVRSRLTRYLGDLHGVNQTWGVSAYQTIQNLASISELRRTR